MIVTHIARFLDLCGEDGRPSFSKLMLVAVLCASIVTREFGVGIATVIIAGAFGRPTLLKLFGRTTLTLSDSRVKELAIEAVRAEPNVWRDSEKD